MTKAEKLERILSRFQEYDNKLSKLGMIDYEAQQMGELIWGSYAQKRLHTCMDFYQVQRDILRAILLEELPLEEGREWFNGILKTNTIMC